MKEMRTRILAAGVLMAVAVAAMTLAAPADAEDVDGGAIAAR